MPKKNFFTNVIENISFVMFALILIVATLNVVGRYTRLFTPFMWVEEMTRYAFIWITFLMWHLVDREKAHFEVNILPASVQKKFAKLLEVINILIVMVFAVLIFWSSKRYIAVTMTLQTESFRWLKLGVIYSIIPIGMLLLVLECLRHLMILFKPDLKFGNKL
jgi:TRAP-type C4-dicarboxylate transport system permease small subunit